MTTPLPPRAITPGPGGGRKQRQCVAAVDRARAGDRDAFGTLYAHYRPLIHQYLYHRTQNRELSADLTSETFLRALRRIESFTWQGRDFGAWLVTIARNLVADHFKRHSVRFERPVGDMHGLDTPVASPEDDVIERLTRPAVTAAVHQAVRQLTPGQQQTLLLRFWDELPFAEIARILGRTPGAAKELRYKAVQRLRTGPLADAVAAAGGSS